MRALSFFFFFNDTATTEIYTLSLHDALPIYPVRGARAPALGVRGGGVRRADARPGGPPRTHRSVVGVPAARRARRGRSEEHTSELQSRLHLVCRLLLEKKKQECTVRRYIVRR